MPQRSLSYRLLRAVLILLLLSASALLVSSLWQQRERVSSRKIVDKPPASVARPKVTNQGDICGASTGPVASRVMGRVTGASRTGRGSSGRGSPAR